MDREPSLYVTNSHINEYSATRLLSTIQIPDEYSNCDYCIFSESNSSQWKTSDKPKVGDLNSSLSSSTSSQIDKRYRCDICQVISSGRIDYESHMAGRKHREREARCFQEPKIRPRLDPSPVSNFVERALGSRKRSSGVSKLTCEKNNNNW